MTADYKPDDETARTYARYKRAVKTERELKDTVRAKAVEDLRNGAKIADLAEWTGLTEEVFRRLARKHDIPVDPRYAGRAELLRARHAADAPPAD